MWSIKFLSGPKAGKTVFLREGLTVLGREESCQVHLPSSAVSKKHAQIIVRKEGLFIEDMGSSNGTFIDGKQIHRQQLQVGDRAALHNIVFEVGKRSDPQHQAFSPLAYSTHPETALEPKDSAKTQNMMEIKGPLFANIKKAIQRYMDDVVLPGVYKLAEWMEFKWIIACFVIGFIVFLTALSSVPLIAILKSSVEQESRNNAENMASALSLINRDHLRKGFYTAIKVDYALRRPGVEKAFVISAIDGRILAPSEMAHSYPKSPIIHKARKQDRNTVEKTGSSIIAVVPIRFYNAETGENRPGAYSVVVYDMGSMMVGVGKVASLLIQNLLIACIVGFILFFFLVKFVEFPIQSLNSQLGKALKDERAPSISIHYQSRHLRELCSHINSALNQISLNKILNAQDEEKEDLEINRQNEMNNLVEVIGFPALSVNVENETVASVNSNFSDQIGNEDILHQPMSEISNSSLKESLVQLLESGKSNPQEISFGELYINHIRFQSACQFVMGKQSPAYAIVVFMPAEAEEGAA